MDCQASHASLVVLVMLLLGGTVVDLLCAVVVGTYMCGVVRV